MKNILEWLEQQEEKRPDALAVDDGNKTYTWRKLSERARAIGELLCEECSPGQPVAILADKSTEVLAAMMGIVYAGCFYVIISPGQPIDRRAHIFQVLDAKVLITGREHREKATEAGYTGKILQLEELMEAAEKAGENKTPQGTAAGDLLKERRQRATDRDILYGIFTSGSTGVPKCIVVSHRAVLDFITHFVDTFHLTAEERFGNQAPFDFDVSVKDIYSSMAVGAPLILIPKELFSTPAGLLDYLEEKQATVLVWAVSALTLVSSLKGLQYKVPSQVKKIMFSGEVMPAKQLRIWQEALPETEFANIYGPTEITCNCTYHKIDRMVEDGEKLPVGIPFEGRKVFLRNTEEKELGGKTVEIGEICVAGESISDGYYHNQEETDKRFLTHTFADGKQAWCYCTGDLGYYGEQGELYFAGRKDFQIKHMGHRIELEEIERSMEQIPGVERSCCGLDTRRGKLVAFYMGEAEVKEIRTRLKKAVPVYMIPQKFVQMEKMPLTKNGKTDRGYFRARLEGNV